MSKYEGEDSPLLKSALLRGEVFHRGVFRTITFQNNKRKVLFEEYQLSKVTNRKN